MRLDAGKNHSLLWEILTTFETNSRLQKLLQMSAEPLVNANEIINSIKIQILQCPADRNP